MAQTRFYIALGMLVAVIGGGAYLVYWGLGEFASAKETARARIAELESDLARTTEENEKLSRDLIAEQAKMADFSAQIEDITGEVGILDRLQKTDKELLQKYSRTYFLNEHYRPSRIEEIPEEYRFPPKEQEYFHKQAWPFLEQLLESAKDDGVILQVASGYRSFDDQKDVKATYLTTYGTASNTFSADQGYSEHQLGTALDFTTPALKGALDGFEKTEAYTWLTENAYRYGFVLSYPKGNTYYQFEPWHWRFVGRSLAKELHHDGKYFYDLDQRDIDEHLVDLFE